MTDHDPATGAPWTESEVDQLRILAAENTPTDQIALRLGRTEAAITHKAAQEAITLPPGSHA